ncbi:MAG: hypothetical protein OES34_06650 [Nitrosopumilus sp.]|nr:hypothetical protein [Nitrosopumilus sp.]
MVHNAKLPATSTRRLRETRKDNIRLHGINRLRQGPIAASTNELGNTGSTGGGIQSSQGNFLETKGDTMVGPIAFYPALTAISTGAIDIGIKSTDYSSRVIISPESGSTDDLVTITGAAFSGQLLFLQGVATNTITIKNSGNIETLDGADFTLADDDIIIFMYDTTDTAWQQVTTGKQTSMGGGASFPIRPTVDNHGNVGTVTEDLDISLVTGHVHILTLTGNPTLTFSNPPASGTQMEFEIEFIQDATGNRTVTWPASVPETVKISSTPGSTTIITVRVNDGGTTYHAIPALRGTIALGGSFALTDLSNLSSPVLPEVLNFNGFSASNFPGYTNLVGQGLVNDTSGVLWTLPSGDSYTWQVNGLDQLEVTDAVVNVKSNTITEYLGWTGAIAGQTSAASATGVEHNLPTGDQYTWKINGTEELQITSLGLAIRNSITFQDTTADPSTPGEIQRNGADVKVFSGGAVVNLSNAGGPPFNDNQVIIQDELDNTKTLTFNLSLNSTGDANILSSATTASRSWTMPDASTTMAGLSVAQTYTVTQTFNDITFDADGTRTIGDSTHHADDVFTESLTLRGSGATTTNTVPWISADSTTMIFNVPSGDGYVFKDNGTTNIQISEDSGSTDYYIRAGAAKKMGFVVDASTVNIGTSGTIQIPVDGGSVGTAAAADTDFGDNVGCIGMYLNTIGSGNPTICFKIDDGTGTDNRWATLIINRTTGAVSGSILT